MKKSVSRRGGLTLLLAVVFATPAFAADAPVAVTGTRVSMVPPERFAAAEQFPGFVLSDGGASIFINELPGPFPQVTGGFTEEDLQTRGIRLLEKKDAAVDGHQGLLLKVAQNARGVEHIKWILALGDKNETLLVTASVPADGEAALGAALLDALLSTRWDQNAEVDFFAGLPFVITVAEPFAPAQKVGNNLLLTLNGQFPPAAPNLPLLIVGSSVSRDVTIADPQRFARERIEQYNGLSDVEVLEQADVSAMGLSGVELKARGIDRRSDSERYIQQRLLFNDNGYLFLVGFADLANRAPFEKAFSAMFDSIAASP